MLVVNLGDVSLVCSFLLLGLPVGGVGGEDQENDIDLLENFVY